MSRAHRSKAKDQKRHAKRRAYERYGLDLNRHEMNALANQIQQGNAKFVEKQSNRVSVFDIKVAGVTARVVYDKLRHVIVTFLPPEALEQYA